MLTAVSVNHKMKIYPVFTIKFHTQQGIQRLYEEGVDVEDDEGVGEEAVEEEEDEEKEKEEADGTQTKDLLLSERRSRRLKSEVNRV